MLHPTEPRGGIRASDQLGELALLRNRQGRTEESGIGEVVEGDALHPVLVDMVRARSEHFVHECRDLREFRTR